MLKGQLEDSGLIRTACCCSPRSHLLLVFEKLFACPTPIQAALWTRSTSKQRCPYYPLGGCRPNVRRGSSSSYHTLFLMVVVSGPRCLRYDNRIRRRLHPVPNWAHEEVSDLGMTGSFRSWQSKFQIFRIEVSQSHFRLFTVPLLTLPAPCQSAQRASVAGQGKSQQAAERIGAPSQL